jgi:DNA-directed RNA polymerase subunit RPC12/RpoP
MEEVYVCLDCDFEAGVSNFVKEGETLVCPLCGSEQVILKDNG